jgi:hypothetical protein
MGKWIGCLGFAALGLFIIFKLPELVFIVGGLGTALVLGAWAHQAWSDSRTRRSFEAAHGRFGRRLILVYSRSPHWQRYIEEQWLPKYGAQAVVLNWSDRSAWRSLRPKPPEVALFERHAGRGEYNPLVIGVAPRGKVRVIRFWRAFRDYKHGKELALRRAETELEALASALRGEDSR